MAGPLEQFVIKPLSPELQFEVAGFDLSFTNSSLWMAIGILVSTIGLTAAMRKKSLVPGRGQVFAEMLYEFVANMIRENMGPKGRSFFPFVFTIFMVVLMGNVLGLIPYSFTYTSHILVTGALALMIFFSVIVIGIFKHGFSFFSLFAPPGVPPILYILLVPIELVSFLARPLTLSVRLFANMMAGHIMLKVFAGFSVLLVSAGVGGLMVGLLPMAFNSVLIAFELLIALLHAYIFALLSCVYLKDAIEIHH